MRKKKQTSIKRMAKRTANALTMLILLSLLLSLYGCEAKKDSIEKDLQSLEASESSGDAEKQGDELKKQLHVPKELHIKALSEDGKRGYQADCEVDVPGNASPSVYQQKEIPFTKETIIKKAKDLFDEGKFTYVKPLDCYTLDELNEEQARLQSKIDKKEDKENRYYNYVAIWNMEDYKYYFNEAEVKEFQEGEFSEGSKAARYDRIMILEGEIEGRVYHLLAFTSNGHNYLKLCLRSWGYDLPNLDSYFGYTMRFYDILNDEMIYSSDDEAPSLYRGLENEIEPTQSERKNYGENVCSYSEEEAEKLALEYASLLYGTDMTVAQTNWTTNVKSEGEVLESMESDYLHSDEEDGTNKAGGYAFYLQRQYDGLSCNESNFWWREVTDSSKETAKKADPSGIVAEQEGCRVEVTDEGVISMDTIEPWYAVTNTMADSTSLMDFPDIEELAKGYLEEMAKDADVAAGSDKNITRINETALRYATVVYDGEYTLIPCWFFHVDGETVLVINAIDGSRVFARRIPIGGNIIVG